MSQSGFIAAALLAAFVFYLAAKGRLPVYAGVLWGPTAQPVPTGAQSSLSNPTTPATMAASATSTVAQAAMAGVEGVNIGQIGSSILGGILPFLGL